MTDTFRTLEDQLSSLTGRPRIDALLQLAERERNHDGERSRTLALEAHGLACEAGETTLIARSSLVLGRTQWSLGDYAAARANTNRALSEARAVADRDTEVRALMALGLIDMDQGRFQEATSRFLAALTLAREHGLAVRAGGCLNNLGGVYEYLGDYASATAYYLQALEVFERLESVEDRIIVRVNLGTTCHRLGRLQEALNLAVEAQELAAASGNRRYEGMSRLNQGMVLSDLGEYDRALELLRGALPLLRVAGHRKGEAEAHRAMGDVYLRREEAGAALAEYVRALWIAASLNDPQEQAEALVRVGSAQLRQGNPGGALQALQRALGLAGRLGLLAEARDAHAQLVLLREREGEHALALAHHREFHAFQQRIFNEAQDRRTQGLMIQHEVEQTRRVAEARRVLNDQLRRANEELAAAYRENQMLLEQLRHQARHDALTGLPNRVAFGDALLGALEHAERHGEMFAVMYLDLDGFKNVNDTLGHDAGDELLVQVATRLRGALREHDTVARLGGDEFTVVATRLTGRRDAEVVADRLLAALHAPFPLRAQEVTVGASIGVSMYPRDGQDTVTLQRLADIAMYEVKRGGKRAVRFTSPGAQRPR